MFSSVVVSYGFPMNDFYDWESWMDAEERTVAEIISDTKRALIIKMLFLKSIETCVVYQKIQRVE